MKDHQSELIDRFFSGELSDTEQVQFKELMLEKPFSKAVDMQARLRRQLLAERAASPIGKLVQEEAQKLDQYIASRSKQRRLTIYSIAATLLLCLSTCLWWSHTRYGDEALIARFNQQIYDDTYAGIPASEDLLRDAKRTFFQGDYARSEELAAAIAQRDSVAFQSGQSILVYALFHQEKYEATIEQINQLLASGQEDKFFPTGGTDNLRWTRLLALIGADKEDDAVFDTDLNYFQNSLNEGYKSKAYQLASMLRSKWRKLAL